MALTPGTKLGTYEIQAPLGAGGMGEVYRATDTKLGRDVAFKVLPAEMAHDAERLARFRREAKALAQLDHANIVTIYSVEEFDGVHFLTMQLIEGQPLDRLIPQDGMSLERIVEIGTGLAEALAAAHEKGIVHRDLKPANVMVSNDGRVKVLDFGLAKDIRTSNLNDATLTSDSRTQVGVVMGTPAYMSPEQTSGRSFDHRSDIFSLGVVLHEMSTGNRPFQGTSSAELVSAILRDSPPLVTVSRSDLPADLARIIRRCLEKDPRHRLQTARDVSNEFRDLARHSSSHASAVTGTSPRVATAPDSVSSRSEEAFRVAVLPFKYKGAEPGLEGFADGITEEIITGLSRFSYLRVIAGTASSRFTSEGMEAGAAAKELGARYVMEGSIRQVGTRLRIAVQLIDVSSGSHLWAETYERAFTSETIFDLQDDLVPRIVSTVADMNGVLPRSMGKAVRNKTPEQMSPYEAVLRSFSYFERITADELAAARSGLELAVRKAPTYADAWALLALLCVQDYVQAFRLQPDSMATGAAAARRAIECGPSNHLAYFALAQVIFFQKEFESFSNAAERAVALNPMDGNTLAFMGELLTYAGYEERGMEFAGRAKQLNPNHPGWYWYADFYNAYRQGDDRKALSCALKVNLHAHYGAHMMIAAAYGQLGETTAAAKAVQELLKLRPDVPKVVISNAANWWNPEYCERLIGGLRKAGMEIPVESGAIPSAKLSTSPSGLRKVPDSGTTRADEGFWVAVLPFKYFGSNSDLPSLAEGLTDDIVTGMAKFSYLRVIARSSTARYARETVDVRAAAKELGAHYVLEGSIRQAGAKVRIAAQLIDANTGAGLWAETYDRRFQAETMLELLDDVVPRIVSTVADTQGILPHSMTETLRNRDPETLTPYEAVLRSFGHFQRVTEAEHAIAKAALERAVKQTPDRADCWAWLSLMYREEYTHNFNLRPDPLGRALAAARRALEVDPSNHLAHAALASTLFFLGELVAFRTAAERALALNPMEGYTCGYLGMLIAYSGDWERGCALAERAMQLNPHHPGWYWFPLVTNAYRQRDYPRALELAHKVNLPGFWRTQLMLAVSDVEIGNQDAARAHARELLKIRPDFRVVGRSELKKWYDNDLVGRLADSLRKAGLEIAEDEKAAPSGAVLLAQSIAVLPFANISADPEQEYFSDGLAEEIINLLAQVPALKVIARTSAFAFRGKEQDIRGIAEALGVSTILEGSVRRSGSRIRVTAQLINAADGCHLWSERYDRELSDIFVVQDEISAAIAKALRVKLSREVVPQRHTPTIEAYEAYLKGRQQQSKVTPESLELARRYYEQASELDPAFGMAHIGLAFYWMTLAHFGQHSIHEGVSAARAEVQRALELDPSLADGHALLGYLAALFDSDWATAEKHFDFPMAKQASFELVKPMYGGVLYLSGKAEEAIKLAQRAVEEDPLDVWSHMNLHAYLQGADRDDEALEQLKKVVELDPNQVVALASMVMIHASKGEIDQALKIARRAYAVGRWFSDTVGLLAALLLRNGDEEESRSIAKELGSGEALGDARAHALFHLICGEIDQGADWVEKAIESRDSSMRFYLGFVICRSLRASHRWPKIAKMVNLRTRAAIDTR